MLGTEIAYCRSFRLAHFIGKCDALATSEERIDSVWIQVELGGSALTPTRTAYTDRFRLQHHFKMVGEDSHPPTVRGFTALICSSRFGEDARVCVFLADR